MPMVYGTDGADIADDALTVAIAPVDTSNRDFTIRYQVIFTDPLV